MCWTETDVNVSDSGTSGMWVREAKRPLPSVPSTVYWDKLVRIYEISKEKLT